MNEIDNIRRQRLLDEITKTPYFELLGVQIEAFEDAPILSAMGADHLIGNINLPALHGGVLGRLLECAASMMLLDKNPQGVTPRLVNIDVDYLRTGRPVKTYASASLVRQGRRVASVKAQLWQEARDRPIAIARVQFLLDRPGRTDANLG